MGRVAWTCGEGPLAPFAAGFRREMLALGHPPGSVKHYVVLMGQLDRWLAAEGIGLADLTAKHTKRFLDDRRLGGGRRVPTLASFSPLFEYLRAQGALAPEPPAVVTPLEQLLARYRQHLVHDRGLAPLTVARYEGFARRFLADRGSRAGTPTGAENLCAQEINAFMLQAGTRLTVESAKREAADLRALLRFLYVEGVLATDLGTAMPPVATWRGGRLPAAMPAGDVDALLGSCDRSTPSGRRNYAIMILLARLGLRAGEVAALEITDIDWRRGEIAVRGKARRRDRLPLPVDVGEALVDYLQSGRPACSWPQLILTLYAPPRPIDRSSITSVVYQACSRAGIDEVGAHRLRHTLATELLRQGADLLEIAQVLRQSDLGTTANYAKVDRAALREVAQPWPGADR